MSNKQYTHYKEIKEHIEFLEFKGYKEITIGTYLIPNKNNISAEEQQSMNFLIDTLDFDFIEKKRSGD